MLFDIETDVLQNSVKSSVLVKLLYPYSSTKDKLPLKYFIRKKYLEEHREELLMATSSISKELFVTLKYFYEKNKTKAE